MAAGKDVPPVCLSSQPIDISLVECWNIHSTNPHNEYKTDVLTGFLNFPSQYLSCCLPLYPSEVRSRTERFDIVLVRWKRFTLNLSCQYASGEILC